MDNFRSLLLSLSDDIGVGELESMKFACKPHIGTGILERLNRPVHLFAELEKRNLLGPENKDFLVDLLVKIGRRDLKNKLLGVQETEVSPRYTVPNAPIVTSTLMETNFYDISEELARDWKALGRKLKLTTSKLDNIDVDYRKVKEKAFQVMLQWKRTNGMKATGQVLANALTLIGRKDVAELLAKLCQSDRVNVLPSLIPHVPAENMEKQESSLENMPENLRTSLPTQEMENPKKDEKDDATDGDFTDSAKDEHSLTNSKVMPTQETKPLVLQNMGNILDPQRYFVIKQIGSGSCGKVYLCQTKDRLYSYAVKQVDLGMNNKETKKQVKNLKKEIEILKKLKHGYIVNLYYSEDTAQTLSIFMEYLPGGSLSDYVMKNGGMEEKLARKYTWQILKGCEYLHENNVIHRDIKGANVLIDGQGNIRLADFGIANDLEKVLTSTGSTKGLSGTIYWSSPEHINGEKPSYVFDIWSVGCTVVEMLTTKPPNYDLNHLAALKRISDMKVDPPDHLSPSAKQFIGMCFRVKEERPNATELLKDEFPTENPPVEEN